MSDSNTERMIYSYKLFFYCLVDFSFSSKNVVMIQLTFPKNISAQRVLWTVTSIWLLSEMREGAGGTKARSSEDLTISGQERWWMGALDTNI